MNSIKKALALIGASFLLFSGAARADVITQLGFIIDGSGSISGTNFAIMRTGYANAFATLPTDGSVELTVLQFGSTGTPTPVVQVLVNNVVITAASLPGVIATMNGMTQITGFTPLWAAIDRMTSELASSPNFSPGIASMINIGTDGEPNMSGISNPDQLTRDEAAQARAAGIDALTIEAIGNFDLTFLRTIVYSPLGGLGSGVVLPINSTPPNPMTSLGWVLPVNSFDDFSTAIHNKIQVITHASEPGSIALLGVALALLGFTTRRRMTR